MPRLPGCLEHCAAIDRVARSDEMMKPISANRSALVRKGRAIPIHFAVSAQTATVSRRFVWLFSNQDLD